MQFFTLIFINVDNDWLIQDVILIGAPVTGNPQDWEGLEKVVAGKIVNCYCRYVVYFELSAITNSTCEPSSPMKAETWQSLITMSTASSSKKFGYGSGTQT